MNVLGYETGPVACQAAFTADFDIATSIPMAQVVTKADIDRRTMDQRPGMRSKYVPLRFDPATGAHQIGGRYLFRSWEDAVDYARFTTEEFESSPGVKFWDQPVFANIVKHAWHVAGAHEFQPVASHYASRLERFTSLSPIRSTVFNSAWVRIREAARDEGLASVWLLSHPGEQRLALVTAATQHPGEDDAERASNTLSALAQRTSLSRHLPSQVDIRKVFDRTSLNLSVWLPLSRRAGGDAAVFPTFPVHPMPLSSDAEAA